MPPARVYGKEKPIRIFAVIRLSSDSEGPNNLSDLRKLLGLETPDLTKVDLNIKETKYEICGPIEEVNNGQ